jgi:hypothetical protein
MSMQERPSRRSGDRHEPIDVVELWVCTARVLCVLLVLALLWRWLA